MRPLVRAIVFLLFVAGLFVAAARLWCELNGSCWLWYRIVELWRY
jgi:hypothetical protein